jgi:hypothetical protein
MNTTISGTRGPNREGIRPSKNTSSEEYKGTLI